MDRMNGTHTIVIGIVIRVFVIYLPYPDYQIPLPIQEGTLLAPPTIGTFIIVPSVVLRLVPFRGIRSALSFKLIGPHKCRS